MRPLSKFQANKKIQIVFCDIDDTITTNGKLGPESYKSLWDLSRDGIKVIPVTGRPAGWCEMIARFWPVDGVIGENGAFYFRYKESSMTRVFAQENNVRESNRKKLDQICDEVLKKVQGSAVASDQFSRIADLAIDFCEDVSPLNKSDIQKIVDIFVANGATAKVSSIHVNGWFGDYDKVSMTETFLKKEYDISEIDDSITFIGDSPNDEPMFKKFPLSFAVANIQSFINELNHKPSFVTSLNGGEGFTEFQKKLTDT